MKKILPLLLFSLVNLYSGSIDLFKDFYSKFKDQKSYVTFSTTVKTRETAYVNGDTLGTDPVYFDHFERYSIRKPVYLYGVSIGTHISPECDIYFNFTAMPKNLDYYPEYFNYSEESYDLSVNYNFSSYLRLNVSGYLKNLNYEKYFSKETLITKPENMLEADQASDYFNSMKVFRITLARRKWNRIIPTVSLVFYDYEEIYPDVEEAFPDQTALWRKVYNTQKARFNVKVTSQLDINVINNLSLRLKYNYTPEVKDRQKYGYPFIRTFFSANLGYSFNKHFYFNTEYNISKSISTVDPVFQTRAWNPDYYELTQYKEYKLKIEENISYENKVTFSVTLR